MDSIVTFIIEKFKQHSEFGQRKYGTNLDRMDFKIFRLGHSYVRRAYGCDSIH
jgi:hypothetical protein